MWKAIRSYCGPIWYRLIAFPLSVAMLWSNHNGWSWTGSELRWFDYPLVFVVYSAIWFVLFVIEQLDHGPFTRARIGCICLFGALALFCILRTISAFIELLLM